jgi:hypothetical protein
VLLTLSHLIVVFVELIPSSASLDCRNNHTLETLSVLTSVNTSSMAELSYIKSFIGRVALITRPEVHLQITLPFTECQLWPTRWWQTIADVLLGLPLSSMTIVFHHRHSFLLENHQFRTMIDKHFSEIRKRGIRFRQVNLPDFPKQ